MRLLVLGATGLVGQQVIKEGTRRGWRVQGTFHEAVGSTEFMALDVVDEAASDEVFNVFQPDAVVNTAAFHNVDKCETEREFAKSVNTLAPAAWARRCASKDAAYVFFSTDYVFDGAKDGAYLETDEPHPLSYYGETKLAGEKAVLHENPQSLVCRASVIYGWNSLKKNFVTWLLGELRAGRRVRIVDDQWNCPTYAPSLAWAVCELLERRAFGLFHSSGSSFCNRFDFSVDAAKAFGLDYSLIDSIKTASLNQKAVRPLKVRLSTKKLEPVVGRSLASVEEGLADMASSADADCFKVADRSK